MILFINVLLTNKRFSRFDRGLLRTDDPLSVFRLMLASLEDIRFSHVYVFAELDPDDYPADLAQVLRQDVARSFGPAAEFRDRRLLRLDEWRDFLSRELLPRNELVFYSGNHDHVFVDFDTQVLDACLAGLADLGRQHGKAGLAYSHWPEWFSYRPRLLAWRRDYFVHTSHYRDAIQVLTPGLLEHWFFADAAQLPGDTRIRRTEDLGWAGNLHYLQLVPHRELFRHYDAGSHFGVRIRRCPPLEVPRGFHDGELRIAYFRTADRASLVEARRQGYTCVGPCFEDNRAVSDEGPDFAWASADIPAFLLRRAREFLVVGDNDAAVEIAHRDRRRCELLADQFPLTPAALALLAPPAVRGDYGPEALPERGDGADHRRSEALFVLKSPVRARPGCVVYLDDERKFSLGQAPAQALLRGIDGNAYLRCYTLLSERKGTAWQPSGSAYHLAGDLYETLDGLAVHTFDFHFDKIAALRDTLADIDCRRVVIVEPQCPAALALLAPILNERVAAELAVTGCFGIRVVQGERAGYLAVALAREDLDRLLAENPRLICNETFSVCDIIAALCRRQGRYSELSLRLADGADAGIEPAAIAIR